MMKILSLISVMLIAVSTLSSCAPDQEESSEQEVATYQATGVVKEFLPDGRHIRISHGEIEGFMSAMTMSFELADTTLFEGLQLEDSVRFNLDVRGADIKVISIEKTE